MDKLIRGFLADRAVSFYAISASELVEKAKRTHDCGATASAALGRSLMACVMMGAMLKDTGDVSLIIKGGGPAGSIICAAKSDGSVKGTIGDPKAELPKRADGKLDVSGIVGKNGTLTVVRDMGLKEPYVGQSRLVSGEVAQDVAAYFTYSQQQPSLVYLGVHINKDFEVAAAGGVIIQPLPFCPDDVIDRLEQTQSSTGTFTTLLESGFTPEQAIKRLFSDLSPEFSEAVVPEYRCDCSRERLAQVLVSLGAEELRDMIQKDGGAELQCHFCNKMYNFSAEELETALTYALGGGDGQHI